MTLTAILLLGLSAGMHAGWNVLGKREHPSTAFFFLATVVGTVLLLPAGIGYGLALLHIPVRVWCFAALSGLFQGGYFAALAGAYRAGHMSIAYPLARSLPTLLVLAVTLLMGRGAQVSGLCMMGIVLVATGCLLLPMRHFSDLRPRNYLNASCLFALLAAVGTTGYSMVDDEALRLLRNTPGLPGGDSLRTLVYYNLESVSATAWLGLFVGLRAEGRAGLRRALRTSLAPAWWTGAAIMLTYALVLIAMAHVSNVSYVVAFRQLSIPLGALLGVVLLKEPGHPPKILGVAILSAGLILVALG